MPVPDPLLGVARDFSPRVMRVGPGEILIDVSGLGRLIGEPPAIAAELKRALIDLAIDGDPAVAPTQTTARLLVRNRAGRADDLQALATTADPAAALASLPVTLLQDVETVSPALNVRDRARPYETFERWGIKTLGALAALPAADLLSRLGRRGQSLHRLAPRGRPPSVRSRSGDPALFRTAGARLADRQSRAVVVHPGAAARSPVARAGTCRPWRGGGASRVAADRSVHASACAAVARGHAGRSRAAYADAARSRSHPPVAAIDIVSLELDPAPARITQFSLLERALPSPETLSTLTARLSALVGETRCGAAGLVDTHQPGAFEMRMFEIAAAGDAGCNLRADGVVLRRQRPPPRHPCADHCWSSGASRRPRRGLPGGAVVQSAGPWRSSGGWWKTRPAGRRLTEDTDGTG